jgi:hypothetical protein
MVGRDFICQGKPHYNHNLRAPGLFLSIRIPNNERAARIR